MCSIRSSTLRTVSRKYRASYNPLAVLKAGQPDHHRRCGPDRGCDGGPAAEQKDPHWDESAKNFIEGVILHVATDPRYEGRRNLLTVRELIRTALLRSAGSRRRRRAACTLEQEMLENAARLQEDENDLRSWRRHRRRGAGFL